MTTTDRSESFLHLIKKPSSLVCCWDLLPWKSAARKFVANFQLLLSGHPQLLPRCWRRTDMTGRYLTKMIEQMLLCSDQACNWETFHVSSSWGIWLCKNIWQVDEIFETLSSPMVSTINFSFNAFFPFSSSCARGSWRLRVPEHTQRSLDYWSSDWKYRWLLLYSRFTIQRFTIRGNFSQKWRWRGGGEV